MKKVSTEQAIKTLQENGYLNTIKAEMKASVIKSIESLGKKGMLPSSIEVKKFSPNEEDLKAISYIIDFMRHHKLKSSLFCLEAELKEMREPERKSSGDGSLLAELVSANPRCLSDPVSKLVR